MRVRFLFFAGAVLALTAAAGWLLRQGDMGDHGVMFAPSVLILRPGESRTVELINNEADVVALAFDLAFDAAVVAVEQAAPAERDVLAGGVAMALPPRRRHGMISFPGLALTGGRTLAPRKAIYRFTVRALAPGVTPINAGGLVAVDYHALRRRLPAASGHITVLPER